MNGCNFITCLYKQWWHQHQNLGAREHFFDDNKVKKWARSAQKIAIFVIFMLKLTNLVYFNTFVITLGEEFFGSFWWRGMPHTMLLWCHHCLQAIQHFDSIPFRQWRPVTVCKPSSILIVYLLDSGAQWRRHCLQAIQHFDSMPFRQWRPVAPPLSASHPAFW